MRSRVGFLSIAFGRAGLGEFLVRAALLTARVSQPNVNAKASTPGSRNSISDSRSPIGYGCRISCQEHPARPPGTTCRATAVPNRNGRQEQA